MTLRELQEKRSRLVAQAREALESIKSNTDETRAAELEARHDTIMGDLDKLDAEIAREQRVAQFERDEETARETRERELRNRRPPFGHTEADAGNNGAEGVTYRQAFCEYIIVGGREESMNAESRAALRAGAANMTPEQRAQITANGGAGGYTVPTELQAELIKVMKAYGPMYNGDITRELITTSGNPLPFPVVDPTAHLTAATTEGVSLPDDASGDFTFTQVNVGAHSFASPWVRVSYELMSDSILNMESVLGDLLGEAMGRTANSLLTIGNGTTQPNGIVTAATVGIQAASSSAIVFNDTIGLLHSVDPAYRDNPKARYMFNDSTLQSLRKLVDGMGRYIWTAGDVTAGVPNKLNDKPYSINQAMAAIGAGNVSVLFGDFNKYIVRKVGAPLIGALQAPQFYPGFGIAAWHRFDGQLLDGGAIKRLTH